MTFEKQLERNEESHVHTWGQKNRTWEKSNTKALENYKLEVFNEQQKNSVVRMDWARWNSLENEVSELAMAKTYKALQGMVKISNLFLNHEKTELFEQGSFLDLTYNFKIKSTLAAM